MQFRRTPARIEKPVRPIGMARKRGRPPLRQRVTPRRNARVSVWREVSERLAARQIDKSQRPIPRDQAEATLLQQSLADDVALSGRTQSLRKGLDKGAMRGGPEIERATWRAEPAALIIEMQRRMPALMPSIPGRNVDDVERQTTLRQIFRRFRFWSGRLFHRLATQEAVCSPYSRAAAITLSSSPRRSAVRGVSPSSQPFSPSMKSVCVQGS